VADHTFTFPTTGTPTTTLTFPTGKCWFEGDEEYYRRNQDYDKTKGGTPRAKSYGANFLIQPFTIFVPKTSESVTDWIDVLAFINSVVNFGLREFIWTDASSVAHTVRMENDDTKPVEHPTYNEYTFQLRVIA
jgi:hypothetical protein